MGYRRRNVIVRRRRCPWAAAGLVVLVLGWPQALLAVEKLRVVALFSDKAMVEIDGKNRLLRKGQATPEGVLLISADTRGAVIEVDGKRETYRLGSHVSSSYRKPEIRLAKIWRDHTGSFTTVGAINGRTVNMLVDTGATSVAMSEVEAKRLGLPYRLKGRKIGVSTASGYSRGYQITLDRVRVGDILLRNVGATVVEGASPREVLLGMTFLQRVQIENSGNVMVLRTKY